MAAERDPKGQVEDFSGQKSVEKLTATANSGFEKLLKTAKEIEKIYDKIRGHAEKTKKVQDSTGKRSSSSMGLAEMGPGAFSNRYAQPPITSQEIGGGGGGGLSRGAMIGMGIMAVGGGMMSMMPSTMSAVSQRLSAEGIAMASSGRYSGRGIITGANALVGYGNATGIGGPTMAAGQLLSQGGYAFGSGTSNRVLSQLGGLSAVSMMTNEQAAGAYASMNGMNFLRLGIRMRDRDGGIKSPNILANELYERLYRGKDPKDISYDLYNPNTMAYQTIMAAAGGNPETYQVLASLLMARWKNKKSLTAKQMGSAQTMLGVMGNPKGIMGTNFEYQSSQNRLSQATEVGAVAGYQGSLSAASAVNNGLASMGELLPPVVNGLSALKATLETLPQAGGAGSFLSGMGSGLMNLAALRMVMGKGSLGGLTGTAGAGARLSGAGKLIPGLGAVLAGGQGYMQAKSKGGFDWGSLLTATGVGAGTGAIFGGGVPGAVVGGLVGGGANLLGQLFGMMGGKGGGEDGAGSMSTQASGNKVAMAMPFAGSYRTSSDFGMRNDPNTGKRKMHNGIDYAMPVGSPVLAAADGVVYDIRHEGKKGFGLYLIIRHQSKDGEEYFTYYGHLQSTVVKVGDKVSQGQIVARSGGQKGTANAGSSTGPHLHFEVRKRPRSGTAVNPHGFFGKLKNSISNLTDGITGKNDPVTINNEQAKTLGVRDPFFNDPKRGGVLEFTGSRLAELLQAGRPFSYDMMAEYEGAGAFKTIKLFNENDANEVATTNLAEDKVSGDSGTMAYGSRKAFMKALYNKGFRGEALHTAFAVALAESGGRARAEGDRSLMTKKWGLSIGPFQIRSLNHPENWGKSGKIRDPKQLYNPDYNINSAWEISKHGKNWTPWTTYTTGSFTKFLDDAKVASAAAGIGGGDGSGSMGGMASHSLTQTASSPSVVVHNAAADRNVNVTVNMNVNIANADLSHTQTLVNSFKKALEREELLGRIGSY